MKLLSRSIVALSCAVALAWMSQRPLSAQPYADGDLLVRLTGCIHRQCSGVIELQPRTGPVTTLVPWNAYGGATDITTGPRNRHAVMLLGLAEFLSIDMATKQTSRQRAVWPHYSASGLALNQTGRIVTLSTDVGFNPHLIEVDSGTGALTSIAAYLPASGRVACRDLTTGDFLFVSWAPSEAGVYRVAANGQSVARISTRTAYDAVQDHLDGSFIISYAGSLERMKGGTSTTLVASTFARVSFDRAPGRGAIVAVSSGALLRYSRSGGSVTQSAHIRLLDHGFARERNLASESLVGRNHFRMNVSFPREANRAFAVGVSASGFQPGIAVGGRRIPLVPDGLFLAAATGRLGGLLRNYVGRLDAQGEATATLDLRSLGAALAGVRLWFAGLTLDPNAPSGIATISKPMVIVLD